MLEPTTAGALRVNGARLWSRLMAMGEIGSNRPRAAAIVKRSPTAIVEGRELFGTGPRAAGCVVRVDAIGNLFMRRPGRDESLPAVLTGSHLDTQPTGGKFDGVYGVLAGLEVIESLNDHGDRHRVTRSRSRVWCNEEGCRFPAAMMGSAVWSGQTAAGEGLCPHRSQRARACARNSQRLGVDARCAREAAAGQGGASKCTSSRDRCSSSSAKTIGVVTGVQHMSRHEVVVLGQEAHAGPTPMEMRARSDSRAGAMCCPRCMRRRRGTGRDARLTVGIIETFPGIAQHRSRPAALHGRSAPSRRASIIARCARRSIGSWPRRSRSTRSRVRSAACGRRRA